MKSALRKFLRTPKTVVHDVGRQRDKCMQRTSSKNDTATYVFVITFMTTCASIYGTRGSTVLALYNISCERNYISGRFATYARNNYLLDDGIKSSEKGEIVAMVWTCPGLGRSGRYKQRTIFWVAPDAGFDVLFGCEKNFNTLPHHLSQFDEGIESGHLTTEVPLSFETGVDRGFLLPVKTSAAAKANRPSTLMPTLTEIQAQLDQDAEKEIEYKRLSELNIGRVHSLGLESTDSLCSVNENGTRLAALTTPDVDSSWFEACSPPKRSCKRSYSLCSQQISSLEDKVDERRRKSIKSSIGLIPTPHGDPDLESPSSMNPLTEHSSSQSDELNYFNDDRTEYNDDSAEQNDGPVTAAASIVQYRSVESYPSPPLSTLRPESIIEGGRIEGSDCISLDGSGSPQQSHGHTLEDSSRKGAVRKFHPKAQKSMMSKRRSSKGSLLLPNLTFDSYWTWDKDVGEYYHEREDTGERLVYKPPPP